MARDWAAANPVVRRLMQSMSAAAAARLQPGRHLHRRVCMLTTVQGTERPDKQRGCQHQELLLPG